MQLSIRLSKAFNFIIICLIASFFSGCESTNPLAPEEKIDLHGEWTAVLIPENLLGNWFWNSMWDMTIGLETIEDSVKTTAILAVEKQGEIFRIIHKFKENVYFVTYFRFSSDNEIRMAASDGAARDIDKVRLLPLLEWYTATRILPWENTTLPPELPGNWHIPDGEEEIVINESSITLSGKNWNIEASQTNGTISRIVIKSGMAQKSFYYRLNIRNYTMEAALKDGLEIIHDKFGHLPESEWSNFSRWWDIKESFPLVEGTRWRYEFNYRNLYDPQLDFFGRWDAKKHDIKASGSFELVLVASKTNSVSSSYRFSSSFHIDKEECYIHHSRVNPENYLPEILSDTTTVEENLVFTNEYLIVEDNDSLWYETEEGRKLFSPVQVSWGTFAYLKMFTYPKSKTEDYFFALLINPSQASPALAFVSHDLFEEECYFIPGRGIKNIHYFHGEYRVMTAPSTYEEELTFELTEFVPGNY